MIRKPLCIALSAAILLGGCATSSQDIASTYVSPLQYQSHDCDQLAAEAQRIQSRVLELGGRLDQAAQNDKTIMGVGLILFWPALFALGGTKAQEAEYSRLKGEYDAVQQSAIARKCATQNSKQSTSATPAIRDGSSTDAPNTITYGVVNFEIVDGFTNTKRTVEVGSRDIAKGQFPGVGDYSEMMPPGGWVPADAEIIGQWTRRYEAADGASRSKVDVTARIGQRTVISTRLGPKSVLPVTYSGWMKRNVGYGDMIIEHAATFKVWYSTDLGLPLKFESSIEASGNYKRLSKESLEILKIE